jgi:hypothetical protein
MTENLEKPPEEKIEVPEEQAAFATLLRKFRIGATVKDTGLPYNIAENIAETGGETAFEDPVILADRLTSWHEYIPPVKRRQIMEQWFASKNIAVPEEAMKVASIRKPVLAEQVSEEKRRADQERLEKFSVDTETGRIRPALQGEKALTYQEAERLSTKIKAEIKESGKKVEEESAFMLNEEGQWIPNPKAKIGVPEMMAWTAIQKAQEKGEKVDPFEIMMKKAEEYKTFRDMMGLGVAQASSGDEIDKMIKYKTLLGGDAELKLLLSSMKDAIVALGTPKGESEEARSLRTQVEQLRQTIEEQRDEQRKKDMEALRGQIGDLKDTVAKAQASVGAKNEFDIMGKVLEVIDRRAAAWENVVKGMVGRPPREMSESQKEFVEGAISETLSKGKKIDELAQKALFE